LRWRNLIRPGILGQAIIAAAIIFLIVGVTWAAQTAIRRASLRLSKCSTLKITLTRFMQPDLQNLLGSLEKFHQYECHKPRHAVARGDEVT